VGSIRQVCRCSREQCPIAQNLLAAQSWRSRYRKLARGEPDAARKRWRRAGANPASESEPDWQPAEHRARNAAAHNPSEALAPASGTL